MRSSTIDSYPSIGPEVRSPRDEKPYEPRRPDPRYTKARQASQKTSRRFPLALEEGWFALVLLAVAIYSVVYSIIAAHWVDHTSILLWSTAAGLLVGLLIAKVRSIPQWILHLGSCLVGHWLSVWLTSTFAFHVSWFVLLANLRTAFSDGPVSVMAPESEMVFLFYLSFLSYFLAYFGAWLVYRAHLPWLVALVYCSILLVNLNYVHQDLSLVVVVLLVALILLVARIQLVSQLAQWKSEGLHTDRAWLRAMTWRVMQFASVIALFSLICGWFIPIQGQPQDGVRFWDYVDNAVNNISQGHVSLQDPGSLVMPYQAPANFFSNQLSITGSVHLPTGDVLYYTTNAGPQYLEGFTYDHFDGHNWTSSTMKNPQSADARVPLPTEAATSYKQVYTQVAILLPPEGPIHYLFAPNQPVSFNVPVNVYGNGIVTAWAQYTPLVQGENYQVTSLVSTASPTDLEALSWPRSDMELWNSDANSTTLFTTYMQTPGDLSQNIVKTTYQWTKGAKNPYDAMKMLESHLSDSTQFTYSIDNPPVPSNIDAADWLLQTHRGFCTYYATTMVMMARLLGVPARMANGFSSGHFDVTHKVWVVQGSDAHSWVQVYFPNYGWINFDPTPGYALNSSSASVNLSPVPTRPVHPTPQVTTPAGKKATPATHSSPSNQAGAGVPAGSNSSNDMLLLNFTGGLLLFSFLLLLLALLVRWWRNLYADGSPVAATYWRFCRVASLFGFSPRAWQTPYEYSHMLSRYFPREARSLWRLTDLFVQERWAAPRNPALIEQEVERLQPELRKVMFGLIRVRAKKR